MDVPENVIDRAHRIGKPTVKNGKQVHTMIVRFTTWRHRTSVYKARKSSSKYKVRLDLTKKRLHTVIKVSKVLEAKNLGYAFADVNCRLCAKVGDVFHYFDTHDDVHTFLAKFGASDETEGQNHEEEIGSEGENENE